MKEIPRIVGVISDTHGLLRPEAAQALHGSDLIIHAGDVGNSDVIAELKTIAPLFVVRGNIDKEAWANDLPANQVVQFGHSSIYVIHDLHDLDLDPEAAGFSAVITGHTHRAHEYRKGKVLFLNPGSAGPKRFDLPITLARLNVEKEPWRVEFIPLSAP
jgi:putative phosphoesterase